jgi:hypothetical protein
MKAILTTAVEVAGIGLIAGGLWMIYVPAALIFAGAAIVGISVWANR